jgi:hypothetical protein
LQLLEELLDATLRDVYALTESCVLVLSLLSRPFVPEPIVQAK